MACFSCSAGWIFSICLVRKSIFRLKNSRASSAVWVDKGQKWRRGAESLQGPHGRQPCLPPTADRRLFWAQPTPPAHRRAAAGRKKAASTPGNCIPLPGLKSRTLRAPSGSSSSGSSSSSSSLSACALRHKQEERFQRERAAFAKPPRGDPGAQPSPSPRSSRFRHRSARAQRPRASQGRTSGRGGQGKWGAGTVTQLWELSSAEPGQSPGASKATPYCWCGLVTDQRHQGLELPTLKALEVLTTWGCGDRKGYRAGERHQQVLPCRRTAEMCEHGSEGSPQSQNTTQSIWEGCYSHICSPRCASHLANPPRAPKN